MNPLHTHTHDAVYKCINAHRKSSRRLNDFLVYRFLLSCHCTLRLILLLISFFLSFFRASFLYCLFFILSLLINLVSFFISIIFSCHSILFCAIRRQSTRNGYVCVCGCLLCLLSLSRLICCVLFDMLQHAACKRWTSDSKIETQSLKV